MVFRKNESCPGQSVRPCEGYAFVIPDEPGIDDIFIPPGEMNNAMHGDTVMVRVSNVQSGTRREGTIIRILERGTTQIVGHLYGKCQFRFVIPDDKKISGDIFIRHMRPWERWKDIKLW